MKDRKIVEIIELDEKRRWKYLKRYYEVAADFYGKGQSVIAEEEIDEYVKKFKEKPSPKIRKDCCLMIPVKMR